MPPASRPIDSSFCAWRSWLSADSLPRSGADVDDGREDLDAFGGLDRRQADLDRELGAVLAPSGQVEADAHGPGDRVGEEAVTVPDVTVGDLVRDEHLDQVPDQLAPRIAEGRFGLGVHVCDAGLRVHREDRVR